MRATDFLESRSPGQAFGDIFIDVLPVDDAKNPDFLAYDFIDGAIIPNPQAPIPGQAAAQGLPIRFRMGREAFLDGLIQTRSDVPIDSGNILRYMRVVEEGVGHFQT